MGGRLCLVVLTIRSLVCVCLGILMFRRGCDSNIVCLTSTGTDAMHACITHRQREKRLQLDDGQKSLQNKYHDTLSCMLTSHFVSLLTMQELIHQDVKED